MLKLRNVWIIFSVLLMIPMTNAIASVGDVCYAKHPTRLIWQRMKNQNVTGNRCTIYNGSFVPVYEGVVGPCIKGVNCDAKPLNVDIGK